MARAQRLRTYVSGADEIVRMFEQMSDVAEDGLSKAAEEATKIVLRAAKQKVPVDTGKLRDSLDVRAEKSRKATKKVWRVYTKGISKGGVRYGFAVEGGTRKKPARPFMRPALDENKQRIKQIINSELVRLIGRVR